ncbi:MAG: hypothetical protein GC180_10250 [Bacteroidetes bacterium]|nr:hypothetical protein [Bacteroidota bacterium]
MHKIIYIIVFLGSTLIAQAQNSAEIKGVVKDSTTNETLIGATVVLKNGDVMITGVTTGSDGTYYLSGISPGYYILEVSYSGYGKQQRSIRAKGGEVNYINFRLGMSTNILITIDVGVKNDLDTAIKIEDVGPPVIGNDVLKHMPTRALPDLINTLPATSKTPNGLSIKGARPSATGYYLGTMPLIARINFSPRSLAQIGVMLGGVAPEYGDFVGGAVVQSLIAVQTRKYFSAEAISSSLFDKYHYSQFDLNFGGPLIMKRVKNKDYNRMVLGFHMDFNLLYQHDPNPSAIGIYQLNPNKLKEIQETPIQVSPNGSGFVKSAEFLTARDFQKVKAKSNADQSNLTWLNKLEYRPKTNISIEAAAVVNRTASKIAPYSSQLLNAQSNPLNTQWTGIAYLNMEHNLLTNFTEEQQKRNQLRRMKYSVSLQYQSIWNKTEDQNLQDDYFRYGYIGKFTAFRAPVYKYVDNGSSGAYRVIENGDTVWVKNYYELQGYSDTLVTFDRTHTANLILANYASTYFNLSPKVQSLNQIASDGGAFLNGKNPTGIYSNMWTSPGTQLVGSSINSGVSKSQTQQFSMSVQGEISKGIHTAKIGMYLEQRSYRAYSVNAMNLWTMMFQSANQGLELDKDHPILHQDANGVFSDSISYNLAFNQNVSNFAKNLRQALIDRGYKDANGNLITPNSYVNVHELNPADLSLKLFNADELLGTGGSNQYVSYYGYDYLGRRTGKYFGVNDFLNNPGQRNIGAFRPLYAAVYAQDYIEIDQMILRLGLRVERFDANTQVLKDPYSLYPVRTASEVKELNGNPVVHPSGIGSDYSVYVNDMKNPTQIVGYRDGNHWFNADGIAISDPSLLAQKTSSGTIQPYLENTNNLSLGTASFRDYQAKIMVLPRFSVEFPISSTARFFAYYDMLAQRPSNVFTPIDDYYFLRYNPTKVLNNPALKPQLTTDYEIGFRQVLNTSSALSLVASYREQRNMIQLVRYYQAFPVSYISYGNIDLSTVKSIRAEYQLRRKHFYLNSSYTFQIADGTGSGTGSQSGLISAGQPNLRNLFPLSFDTRHNIKLTYFHNFGEGRDYEGPVVAGKPIFENAGIGLTLNAFSGTPFTSNVIATPDAQSGIALRSPIHGTPNGSRLPWSLNNNINLYKNFPVVLGKKDGKLIRANFTVTMWIENFLNVKNVVSVHPYSGSASTDGYLNSANGRQAIESAGSAQSFVDLYNARLANPDYYSLPRRTRLSLLLTF